MTDVVLFDERLKLTIAPPCNDSGHLRESMKMEETRAGFSVSPLVDPMLKRGDTDIYRQVMDEIDKRLLVCVLASMRGNLLRTAAVLGISRTTLRKKIKALGIGVASEVTAKTGEAAVSE